MTLIRFKHLRRIRMVTNPRGISLVIALVLIAFLTVLGSTAVKMTTTDLSIGATYKSTQTAFYHAEAGLAYTLSRLSDLLDTGTLSLDGRLETESHSFTPPAGSTFQIAARDTFSNAVLPISLIIQYVSHYPVPPSRLSSRLDL